MQRRLFFFLSIAFFFLSGCDEKPVESSPEPLAYSFDLDSIKSRGTITALVDNSTTSYFVYKGQPMGFEYDLAKAFESEISTGIRVFFT